MSLGSDGLSVEYRTFWDDIMVLLLESLSTAYEKGELPPIQKERL